MESVEFHNEGAQFAHLQLSIGLRPTHSVCPWTGMPYIHVYRLGSNRTISIATLLTLKRRPSCFEGMT